MGEDVHPVYATDMEHFGIKMWPLDPHKSKRPMEYGVALVILLVLLDWRCIFLNED